jgi:hypothetical protein
MDLEYRLITKAAPVQAEGRIAGCPFYFRARHQEWTFAVAERPGVDPVELEETVNEDRGWVRSGRFEQPYEGSHLPADAADMLIRECAAEYLRTRAT